MFLEELNTVDLPGYGSSLGKSTVCLPSLGLIVYSTSPIYLHQGQLLHELNITLSVSIITKSPT